MSDNEPQRYTRMLGFALLHPNQQMVEMIMRYRRAYVYFFTVNLAERNLHLLTQKYEIYFDWLKRPFFREGLKSRLSKGGRGIS